MTIRPFDVGDQMRDGLLHHTRRFDHLRQEHFPSTEEIADDVHAAHQRAFDDRQRRLASRSERGAAFFGISDDEIADALDQCM